jgi:transposase
VILLLDSGWSQKKISEALLLDPKTIKRYESLYEEGGIELLFSDNYAGRESSLSDEEQEELKTKLKSNTGRQRANLSGALDSETHEVIVQEHKTLNAEATISFFRILERRCPGAGVIYIILDNAGYYKVEKIREYLKTSRIKIIFLPPYAPNLNLI